VRNRRYLAIAAGVVVILAVLGGVSAFILVGDSSQEQDHRAQVWGTLLTAAGIAVPLMFWASRTWIRSRSVGVVSPEQRVAAADHLAAKTKAYWGDQARRQGITPAAPVAVRWRAGPEDLAPATALGQASALSEGVVTAWYDDLYGRLGTDFLVVLGAPGSGKSGALLLLLLEALRRRAELPNPQRTATPVPVWVTCGSWNPAETSLHQHVETVLARDYPGLTSLAHGGRAGPAALVQHAQVAVFLDGLDEMPATLRSVALDAIIASSQMSVVLTSRIDEYRAVAASGRFRPASVIELLPVAPDAAAAFLLDRQPSARCAAWQPVLDRLHSQPTSALARVLATPLGLVLARDTYSHADPGALLDLGYDTDSEVLTHLFGAFLDHAYPATAQDTRHRTSALNWLSWTAQSMGSNRDLRWWDLYKCLPRWQWRLAAEIRGGVLIGLAAGLAIGIGLGAGLASGLAVGLAVGLLVGFMNEFLESFRDRLSKILIRVVAAFRGEFVIGPNVPHRLTLRKLTPREFRTALVVGIVRGLLSGGSVSAAIGLLVILGIDIHLGLPVVFGAAIGGGLAYGLMVGFADAWATPLDDSPAVTPADSYHTSLSINLVFGPLLGLGVGSVVGLMVGLGAGPSAGAEVGLVVGPLIAFLGFLNVGYLPWLKAAELILTARTRHRVRFMPLFEEALDRQVLRQAGMVYQFRHAELQDYLAARHQTGHPPFRRPTQPMPTVTNSSSVTDIDLANEETSTL
jgi:hypothetical protein